MSISLIITFCASDAKFLERCASSAMWQLALNDQLILVQDDKAFTAGHFISSHGPPIVRVASGGGGVSAARNAGLLAATGDWVKFLDVDDLLVPFALDKIRNQNPIPLLAGGLITVHNGTIIRFSQPKRETVLKWMYRSNPTLVSASAMSRAAIAAVGGFDERIHFEEDWDLWLRLHRMFGDSGVGAISDPLCFYTIDDALRAEKDKTRSHMVEGVDVREYFRKTYNCNPA